MSSAITLFGVLVADWRNTVRQKRQHEFDAEQKRLDRTIALRHEIYVPIMDVLAEAIAYTAAQAELTFDGSDLVQDSRAVNPLGKLNASIAKVVLISEANTAVLAGEVDALFAKTNGELLSMAEPYQNAQMEFKAAEIMNAKLEVHFERVTALLDSRHESGAPKDEGWRALVSQQEKFSKALAEAEEELSTLHDAVRFENVEYVRKVAEHTPALEALILDLVSAMRAELMYTTDSTALAAELHHKMKLARTAALSRVNKMQQRSKAEHTPNV